MKNLVLTIVTTNGGWLTRLALKYTTIGLASVSSFLLANNVSGDHTNAIVAGLGAAAAAGIEQVLSFIARKYVVK